MNVVPKRARMTVITRDSKYSRAVDFLKAASAMYLARFLIPSPEPLQCVLCCGLLRSLLRQAYATGHELSIYLNLDREQFLVVGSFFAGNDIFCPAELRGLQPLLKTCFEVR